MYDKISRLCTTVCTRIRNTYAVPSFLFFSLFAVSDPHWKIQNSPSFFPFLTSLCPLTIGVSPALRTWIGCRKPCRVSPKAQFHQIFTETFWAKQFFKRSKKVFFLSKKVLSLMLLQHLSTNIQWYTIPTTVLVQELDLYLILGLWSLHCVSIYQINLLCTINRSYYAALRVCTTFYHQ